MRGIKYYTLNEISKELGITKSAYLYRLRRTKIKPIIIGNCCLLSDKQVGKIGSLIKKNPIYVKPAFFPKETFIDYIKECCATVSDTARIFNVSRQAVLKKINNNKLFAYRIKGIKQYFIPLSELGINHKNDYKLNKRIRNIPRDLSSLKDAINKDIIDFSKSILDEKRKRKALERKREETMSDHETINDIFLKAALRH